MRTRITLTALLTLLLAIGAVAAYAAPPTESGPVERFENVDFFFSAEDEAANLTLLGGPPPEQGCIGQGFTPTVDAQAVTLKSGVVIALAKGEQPFFVYDASSLFEVCAGIYPGWPVDFDPTDPQAGPELLAEGIGYVVNADNDLFSSASDTNRTNAFAVNAHGLLTSPEGSNCSMNAQLVAQIRNGEFRLLTETVSLNC